MEKFFEFLLQYWLPISLSSIVIVTSVVSTILGNKAAEVARQKEREEAGRKRKESQRRSQENIRRARVRKLWLRQNKPELYYNPMNGITAVVRPADYEATKERTRRARLDGFWDNENLLMPCPQTYLFVNKQGMAKIEANISREVILYSGLLSALADISKSAELVLKEDIFVPFVNESIIPFSEQRETCKETQCGSEFWLIDTQAPKESQPLQDGESFVETGSLDAGICLDSGIFFEEDNPEDLEISPDIEDPDE